MATTVNDDLNALNQMLAAAGLKPTTLTANSSVADYLSALNSVFSVVKVQMDQAVQLAAQSDALLGTNFAAQIQAQEAQIISLYQSGLASLASANPSLSLSSALGGTTSGGTTTPSGGGTTPSGGGTTPSGGGTTSPAPLPTTSYIAPVAYSGDGVRIFGDTPMLLRETDYTVPSTAAYTRSGSSTNVFLSPEISNDLTKIGSATYTDTTTATKVLHEAWIDAAKGLIGEAIKDLPGGSVAVAASDARDVGNAMNGTLNGTMNLLSNLTNVLNGQMSVSDWLSAQDAFMQKEQAKYNGMAAASVTGKLPAGWVFAPVVDKLFSVTVEEQVTNSFQLSASLDTSIPGGPKNNVVVAGKQNNKIKLGDGHSGAAGGDGGNTFTVGVGNDIIIGGKGLDVVVLPTTRSNYTITKNADGTTAVSTTKAGVAGTDTIIKVERLQFSDGTLALDTGAGQIAGEAYRVYKAAFNRTPDTAGLKYWIGVMDSGATPTAVAGGFMGSAEFTKLYGTNPSNSDLLNKIYTNVLGRAPDAGGFKFWLDHLNANDLGRDQLLANFSESPENQAYVVGIIQNGIWLT